MAAFKFFNIGKANEEITRLEAELATAQAVAKTSTENSAAVSEQAEKLQADLKQASADLETAKASISSLTARAEKSEADLKVANDKIANPSEQIKILGSKEALKITAAQGQPPVVAGSAGTGAGTTDIIAEHAAITDPAKRAQFYRKNKAAYDAAWSAKNPPKPDTE